MTLMPQKYLLQCHVCKNGSRRGSQSGAVLLRNAIQLDGYPKNKKRIPGIHILQFWAAIYAFHMDAQENDRCGLRQQQLGGCPTIYTAVQYISES